MIFKPIPPGQPWASSMAAMHDGKMDSRVAAVVELPPEPPSIIGSRVYAGINTVKPGANLDVKDNFVR